MLNPFKPSEIVSLPGDFFGRDQEIQSLTRAVQQGRHVAVTGPVAIGKSSLVARLRLDLEGFATTHRCGSILTVGHRGVDSVDSAAHLILSELVDVDAITDEFSVHAGAKIGFRFRSTSVKEHFREGRHLAVLQEILLRHAPEHTDLLLIIVDEVDKCSIPIAQLFRAILTKLQFEEVKNVRFIFAGVGSYLQDMIAEDKGVGRFLAKPLSVRPLLPEEAEDLISTKLALVAQDAIEQGHSVEFDTSIVDALVQLSGGHPHLLQYLGYHLIEKEFEDPDGVLSVKDLVGSFREICYEDRAYIYDPLVTRLRQEGTLEPLKSLFYAAARRLPTWIHRDDAISVCDPETLEWFVANDVLLLASSGYQLVDELLRVRILIDEQEETPRSIERRLLVDGAYSTEKEDFRDGYLEDYFTEEEADNDDEW